MPQTDPVKLTMSLEITADGDTLATDLGRLLQALRAELETPKWSGRIRRIRFDRERARL